MKRRYAPVFPLPVMNLFPETVAAYHIFENRYREMVHDALEGDGLIAMALLKPGDEADYERTSEIHPVGCLGQIIEHEYLEDGKINILLRGLERVGFAAPVQDYPYRVFELHPLAEVEVVKDTSLLRESLIQRLGYLTETAPGELDLQFHLEPAMKLSILVNSLARALPLTSEAQYGLLAMDSILERGEKILWYLDDHIETIELLKQADPQAPTPFHMN